MAQIIQHFCDSSGQTLNQSKSSILFSAHVNQAVIADIKCIFPVPNMVDNFTHLGHPLILPTKNRTVPYNFVLDKFMAKLPGYKANMLSHVVRLELIRSVFSTIPVYYMYNILFTKKFIAKLTLRAWKDICTSKQEGWLGIRNLQAVNQGLENC